MRKSSRKNRVAKVVAVVVFVGMIISGRAVQPPRAPRFTTVTQTARGE